MACQNGDKWVLETACQKQEKGTEVQELLGLCMRCEKRKKNQPNQEPTVGYAPRIIHKTRLGAIYYVDAMKLLAALPSDSVDLIITDPAYESLERWRNIGTTTRLKESTQSSNKWFPIFQNVKFPGFFQECYRVLKTPSHFYMFCDEETRDVVVTGFNPKAKIQQFNFSCILNAGFDYKKSLIYDKCVLGMGYSYRSQHEFILFAEKRNGRNYRKLNDLGVGDVLSVRQSRKRNLYPTEKPEALIWKLMTQSSEEGEVVLDPFMGSGVVPYIAERTGRQFIAGDINEASCEYAINRFRDLAG